MSQEYWDGVTRSAEVVDTWPDWKLDASNLKSRERRRASGEILPKPDKDSAQLAQRDATIAELRAEVERLKERDQTWEWVVKAKDTQIHQFVDAHDELARANADLRASHERLRKALAEIIVESFDLCHGGDGRGWSCHACDAKASGPLCTLEGVPHEQDCPVIRARAALSAAPKESVD